MRRWLVPMVAFALTAALVHVSTVVAVPSVIMGKVMGVLEARVGANRFYHAPRRTYTDRDVVRPGPDLAYSVCVYDLTDGPVRVSGRLGAGYLSVSAFAHNTDNYFVLNDRQMTGGGFDLVFTRDSAASVPAGAREVVSPDVSGVLLVRQIIVDDAHFERIDQLRAGFTCEAV